jgi:macrolide-specific efflux system membrane fusion protein
MMKKKILISLITLIITLVTWYAAPKKKGNSDNSRRQQHEAAREPIEKTVEATGSIIANNRVEVKPPIAGRIEKLLVEEGAAVKAGQIIAWMSSLDRAAILDAALAQGPEELKKWETSYKATPIIAPLSGKVILRNVVVGETVSASNVLFALADELVVLAQVDESEIGRINVGMPVRIVLDSYPEEKLTGKVFRIKHEGVNTSNVITYGARVQLDKVPSFVRSQMTATVSFVVSRKDDAIVIPATAIVETASGGKQVLVPGEGGKPVTRDVVTGIEGPDKVEIVAGLSAGDKVLVGSGRYTPQAGPASSPLSMGSRSGQAQTGSGAGSSSRRRGTASR